MVEGLVVEGSEARWRAGETAKAAEVERGRAGEGTPGEEGWGMAAATAAGEEGIGNA